MRAALGLDAAWSAANPWGAALAVDGGSGWRLVLAAPDIAGFLGRDSGAPAPEPESLLARCRELAGVEPQCVAVDMPIVPHGRVTGRRESDNAISRTFGGRRCSTHSPTPERPGALGEDFSRGLEAQGYHVAVAGCAPTGRDLLEVYPHPALLALTGEPMRLPYKCSKTGKYWPGLPRAERVERLLGVWRAIREALCGRMEIAPGVLPPPDGTRLKAYEDMLDAVVCAWVGACYLDGAATAYGDAASSIWVPRGA